MEIRPGDYFKREIIVTNKGSLDQIVSVDKSLKDVIYKDLFQLTIGENSNTEIITKGEFRLNAGESKIVTLNLIPNEEKLNNIYQSETFNELLGEIELTGRQINATAEQVSK